MFKSLDSFCNYLALEKRYSVHTINSYRTDIGQLLKYVEKEYEITDLALIKATIVRTWIVSLIEQGQVAKTINRKLSALRSFYNFCKRKKIVNKNPLAKIVAPKIPKRLPEYIRKESIEKLFDTIGEDFDYPTFRDRLIIELLYSTGIRRAELINVTASDVMPSDCLLKVLGKGSKERLIPLSSKLVQKLLTLMDLKEDYFESSAVAYLFLTDQGKMMYPKFVYNIVTKLVGSVSSSKKRSPHILRHSFATHLTNNGADINAIKELLGHANLAATQVYTHNSIAKLKEVYNKSHPKAKD